MHSPKNRTTQLQNRVLWSLDLGMKDLKGESEESSLGGKSEVRSWGLLAPRTSANFQLYLPATWTLPEVGGPTVNKGVLHILELTQN